MKYEQTILLKNGKEAVIRNGDELDGNDVFDVFNRTHGETDYLLTYPNENSLELNVIAENERALSLYRSLGFIEYGRNPRGFNSKISGYQELVYMLLEL